ncbi:MAG: phospholipase D family protein [Dehalococcoidia bacterium]|nr:phospholipase D family protein [Dehalococcoidia bacterium]MDH4367088.1 phospholipase D family protein [Dehalococcoidia bacterium]
MAEFLNKDKAYAEIVSIIEGASNEVVLITPYIKMADDLFARLKYKDGKGMKTVVVCRGKELASEERSKLKQLRHLELRFDENLHAKCFYNEYAMVITSLNLHEHSQQYNREMGVLLHLAEDESVLKEALREAEYIVTSARKDSTVKGIFEAIGKEAKSLVDSQTEDRPRKTRGYRSTSEPGFCIRCGKRIDHNVDAPHCLDCYKVWKRHGNPEYKERYCHSCGKLKEGITKAKPRCSTCCGR